MASDLTLTKITVEVQPGRPAEIASG